MNVKNKILLIINNNNNIHNMDIFFIIGKLLRYNLRYRYRYTNLYEGEE